LELNEKLRAYWGQVKKEVTFKILKIGIRIIFRGVCLEAVHKGSLAAFVWVMAL
jgi:hypothetical protein